MARSKSPARHTNKVRPDEPHKDFPRRPEDDERVPLTTADVQEELKEYVAELRAYLARVEREEAAAVGKMGGNTQGAESEYRWKPTGGGEDSPEVANESSAGRRQTQHATALINPRREVRHERTK